MPGHAGHDADKIAGAENVSSLLGDYLGMLGNLYLTALNDVKTVGFSLAFDEYIGAFPEIDKR